MLLPTAAVDAADILVTIGPTFREAIIAKILNSEITWNRTMALARISGVFQMNNIEDDRHTHTEQVFLRDINTLLIGESFNKATAGYNPDLTLYQVVFSYWVNPISYNVGGKPLCSLKNQRGIYPQTVKTYTNLAGTEINCAAVAIAFVLSKDGYYGAPMVANPLHRGYADVFARNASDIQEKLQWGSEIAFTELSKALDIFKQYRIVVIQPTFANSRTTDWAGTEYVKDGSNKIIYLYWHPEGRHYYGVKTPVAFMKGNKNSNSMCWCYDCSEQYKIGSQKCLCMEEVGPKLVIKKRKECPECFATYASGHRHICFFTECHVCHMYFNKGTPQEYTQHRCPLYKPAKTLKPRFEGENDFPLDEENKMCPPDKSTQLWVYDLESCIIPTRLQTNLGTLDFTLDDDAKFMLDEESNPVFFEATRYDQIPNLVCYQNVFTGEMRTTSSIEDFVQFMLTHNDGRNTCMAHNGSGYDSRLIMETLSTIVPDGTSISPLMRGGKIMNLVVGNTRFTDTMLHLPGSLKSLAKDFLADSDVVLEKGYFPHLFNSPDNYSYIGPIPDKKYFDLSFTIGKDSDMTEFNTFYDSWAGREDWHFEQQLKDYCINDVQVLAAIAKIHHESCVEVLYDYQPKLAVSPWHFTTAAGYIHALFLADISFGVDIDKYDPVAIDKLAKEGWCALLPEEYYFARLALRGGRTETVRHHYKAEPGQKIKDLDVQSMYPFCQIGKQISVADVEIPLLYPVGYPTVEIFDTNYHPCNLHWDNPARICNCPLVKKVKYASKKLRLKTITDPTDPHTYLDNFFGIAMIDATPPPKLFNPVLPVFDPVGMKCLFSLEPIVAKTFTSVEIQVAIRAGYVVTKIYRADRYKSDTSKWTSLMRELYKLKLYNSQEAKPNSQNIFNETKEEWQTRVKQVYFEKFGLDIDFNNWGKRPARKMTGKIFINSGWGKHAESVDHPQTTILDETMTSDGYHFYSSLMDNTNVIKEITQMTPSKTIFKYAVSRSKVQPNLHKGYLPCSIFVPAYGRLMLWNELGKLKERVIMCDTDSVKYIAEPDGYEIEKGDCLGDWEEEPTEMTEFVSLGPKTYGQKFADGSSTFKCKGLSLKRSHGEVMNFDVAKRILLENDRADVPQMTFDYKPGKGISTRKFIKTIKFKPEFLKGVYDPVTTKLYPFGYDRS